MENQQNKTIDKKKNRLSNGDILLKLGRIIRDINNYEDLIKVCEATLILLLQNQIIPGRNLDKMKIFSADICYKIQQIHPDIDTLAVEIKNMLILLEEKNIIPQNYKEIYGYEITKSKEELNSNNFMKNFKLLLNNEKQRGQETYSWCLLNQGGEFVWYDKQTGQEFGFQKEGYKPNLFTLIIPQSKQRLITKISRQQNSPINKEIYIFNDLNNENKFIFSYVIFSRRSAKEYLEKLLKDKKKTQQQKLEEIQNDDDDQLFYKKYLKAVVSKFSIKNFTLNQQEFRDMLQQQPNIRGFFLLKEIFQFESPDDEKQKFATLIMVKTRELKNVPQYNYSQLKNELIVKEMKQTMINKIKDEIFKKSKQLILQKSILKIIQLKNFFKENNE